MKLNWKHDEKPSGKTIEVKPEVIIEARSVRLVAIGLLNSAEDLIVHLQLLAVLTWMRVRR